MGRLNLPESGLVYVDAQILIYTVERHSTFEPVLRELWALADEAKLDVVTSDLSVLETTVVPLRDKNTALLAAFESFLAPPILRLIPISLGVIREAAQLRAEQRILRTPDAIHLATAASVSAALFLTNDRRLKGSAKLDLSILADAIS